MTGLVMNTKKGVDEETINADDLGERNKKKCKY